VLLARAHPDDAERRDVGRETDGEGGEDDVEDDGEGELQPRDKEGVKINQLFLLLSGCQRRLSAFDDFLLVVVCVHPLQRSPKGRPGRQ
jgi:hypothetical protein